MMFQPFLDVILLIHSFLGDIPPSTTLLWIFRMVVPVLLFYVYFKYQPATEKTSTGPERYARHRRAIFLESPSSPLVEGMQYESVVHGVTGGSAVYSKSELLRIRRLAQSDAYPRQLQGLTLVTNEAVYRIRGGNTDGGKQQYQQQHVSVTHVDESNIDMDDVNQVILSVTPEDEAAYRRCVKALIIGKEFPTLRRVFQVLCGAMKFDNHSAQVARQVVKIIGEDVKITKNRVFWCLVVRCACSDGNLPLATELMQSMDSLDIKVDEATMDMVLNKYKEFKVSETSSSGSLVSKDSETTSTLAVSNSVVKDIGYVINDTSEDNSGTPKPKTVLNVEAPEFIPISQQSTPLWDPLGWMQARSHPQCQPRPHSHSHSASPTCILNPHAPVFTHRPGQHGPYASPGLTRRRVSRQTSVLPLPFTPHVLVDAPTALPIYVKDAISRPQASGRGPLPTITEDTTVDCSQEQSLDGDCGDRQ